MTTSTFATQLLFFLRGSREARALKIQSHILLLVGSQILQEGTMFEQWRREELRDQTKNYR